MSRFNVIESEVGKRELTNHKTLFSSPFFASSQNGKISRSGYFCFFCGSLWACTETAEKTNQSQRFFDQVATGLVYTPKVRPLQYVLEILPLYPSDMFPPEQSGAKKNQLK